MNIPALRRRPALPIASELSEVPALLARVYAQRGITSKQQLQRDLSHLMAPHSMRGSDAAAQLLAQAIAEQWQIIIVGDFDADGATSTALAVLALRAMGAANVEFLVPNRFLYGYGLTVPVVDLVRERSALFAQPMQQLIVTVDNGIASMAGVAHAKTLGMQVLITDHHLPGPQLPDADVIVNPNVPGCEFPSKSLAGVGVMFYVLLALRAHLRAQNAAGAEVNLAQFLDLVALGTVADMVALDANNRVLIYQGLQRIRAGQCRPGILSLLAIARRDRARLTASDLAFAIAPRLNAAGRLDDMSRGIHCLLADDAATALALAQKLDELNLERRQIESDMLGDADEILRSHRQFESVLPAGLCLFDEQWHQGVIGLIAGRVKDRVHRPTICFAPGQGNELKGSARSVTGVHIRDALADIANQHPELLSRFGGHAMAAGMTIEREHLSRFAELFNDAVTRRWGDAPLQPEIWSDGELSDTQFNLDNALALREGGPWGQHFPEPIFDGEFVVHNTRAIGEKHLRLVLYAGRGPGKVMVNAIAFDYERKNYRPGKTVHCAYKLDINEYNGRTDLQLMIEQFF